MIGAGNFFLGNARFEMRQMIMPEPKENEIVIRNMAAGICGTDVHIYHGEKGSADVTPPVVLGHEYAGIVEQVGSGVADFKPGDHVAVDPNIYCGRCRPCLTGKKQHCSSLAAIGVNRDGGFAQYSVVPASQAFLLKPGVPFEAGAMAEPLACCIHGIDNARIRTGDRVLVIGGGAIGLLMVQLARLSGASAVILSEPVRARREIAMQLGADYVIDPIAQNVGEEIRSLLNGDGADVVIECVGRIQATAQAFEAAGHGASIVLFSVPGVDAKFELPLFDVFKKELRIAGSFINPDTHRRAVDLINSGKISTEPLVTHRYPLSKLEEAVQMQMSSESIKVQVLPNG